MRDLKCFFKFCYANGFYYYKNRIRLIFLLTCMFSTVFEAKYWCFVLGDESALWINR